MLTGVMANTDTHRHQQGLQDKSWDLDPVMGATACYSQAASSAACLGDAATACYSLQRDDRTSSWSCRLGCWRIGVTSSSSSDWDREFGLLLLLPL
jgi:hypothetical protein